MAARRLRAPGAFVALLLTALLAPVARAETPPTDVAVLRIAGADRVATAVAVSQAGWSRSAAVVVARSDDPADALAGSALAGSLAAPVLITPSARLADAAADEVRRLGAREAFVLGGLDAVRPAVVAGLRAAGVTTVRRIAGATRYDTAAAVADEVTSATGGTVVLVGAWPDAIGVAGLSARQAGSGQPWPVLLGADPLPQATRDALARLRPARVLLVGGAAVLSEELAADLAADGARVDRLAGDDRYATSLRVAQADRPSPTGHLIVATNDAFPDGLGAGALAAQWDATLVMTPRDHADADQRAWLDQQVGRFERLTVVGGPVAVADTTVETLARTVGLAEGGSTTSAVPAWEADVTLHVDVGAPDGGDGTAEDPMRRITDALDAAREANRDGASVRVVVAAGTYREQLQVMGGDGATPSPLHVQGMGDVVVSGSEPFTAWSEQEDGTWSHPWTRDWGVAPIPEEWRDSAVVDHLAAHPVTRRREMVFVDGQRMRQVTAEADLGPDTFLVDQAGDRILLRPRHGSPATALVEVALRDSLLLVDHVDNVTISGVTFQHAASSVQQAALSVADSTHVRLHDVTAIQNSWRGIGVTRSDGVVLDHVRANHNGVSGLTAGDVDDLLVVSSETSYNDWRGSRGSEDFPVNLTTWAAGQKFLQVDGARFTDHVAVGNASAGLWFDSGNRDVVVERARLTDNLTWGLFVEASPGPLRVVDSRICRNDIGLQIANSTAGTIVDTTLADNAAVQVHLVGPRVRNGLTSSGWSVRDSRIASGPNQLAVATRSSAATWTAFVSDYVGHGNTWSAEQGDVAFLADGGRDLDLAGWKAETGQDGDARGESGPPGC